MEQSIKDIFVKKNINGIKVEIFQVNISHIAKMSLIQCEQHEKIIYLISFLTRLDSKEVNFEELLEIRDMELISFLVETINIMFSSLKI